MLVKLSSAKAAFLRFPPRCWGRRLLRAGDKGSEGTPRSCLAPLSYRYNKRDLRPPLYLFFFSLYMHTDVYRHTLSLFGVIFLLSYL